MTLFIRIMISLWREKGSPSKENRYYKVYVLYNYQRKVPLTTSHTSFSYSHNFSSSKLNNTNFSNYSLLGMRKMVRTILFRILNSNQIFLYRWSYMFPLIITLLRKTSYWKVFIAVSFLSHRPRIVLTDGFIMIKIVVTFIL